MLLLIYFLGCHWFEKNLWNCISNWFYLNLEWPPCSRHPVHIYCWIKVSFKSAYVLEWCLLHFHLQISLMWKWPCQRYPSDMCSWCFCHKDYRYRIFRDPLDVTWKSQMGLTSDFASKYYLKNLNPSSQNLTLVQRQTVYSVCVMWMAVSHVV